MALPIVLTGLLCLAVGAQPSSVSVRDLQKRIEASAPQSTITIPAGRIQGSLRIDKPITLRGAGRRATTVVSKGQKATLIVSAPKDTTVHIQDMSFTSGPKTSRHRGAGVMLGGPGTIKFTNVELHRTIAGNCIGSAIQARSPITLFMDHVQISDHQCYVAGVIAVRPGMKVTIRQSIIEGNTGELSGAILVTGGHLLLDHTQFRANRFLRGKNGQALTLANQGPAKLTMVAVEFLDNRDPPLAFEGKQNPEVRFSEMSWPQPDPPHFAQPPEQGQP